MPVWAWIVVGLVVLLGGAKLYDWNGKRHGHRPGTGAEANVDLSHYQRGIGAGDAGLNGPVGGGS